MDALSIAVVLALSIHPAPLDLDFDAPERASRAEIDSPFLKDEVLAAMAWPYKYGVTQMPCKAKEWQPQRGWTPAREPAGRIEWIHGDVTKVRWSGIYGTCFIQSPLDREQMTEFERTVLECECNGWLPSRKVEFPQP
ncbi:MAG: hypothetical protein ACXWHZ_19805 [Usitatibacter sp.]